MQREPQLGNAASTARRGAALTLTRGVVAAAARRGSIPLPCGTRGNVIRVLVPLTASDLLLDEGPALLADCFTSRR
jgi:4-aminobutyrate aminotransferase/(S)-3-amino-2-methylpropionate transaminase